MVKYIIQPGDTLYFLALKFGTSVKCIMDYNHLTSPHSIYPGQVLNIPFFNMHRQGPTRLPTLKKGDKGPLVVLLQSMLSANGFPSLMINGFYDDYTQVCVSSLQTKWRIPVTGNARGATWRVLLDDTVTSNTPLYNCIMIRSGLLLVLTLDKSSYKPCEFIKISLVKMNLSGKSIILNYNNGQRYDFGIAYSRGRILWRWSDDKSFTQVTGRVVIPPGQSIKYTEAFRLPKEFKHQEFTLYARNTAKQTSHIRLEVNIRTSP